MVVILPPAFCMMPPVPSTHSTVESCQLPRGMRSLHLSALPRVRQPGVVELGLSWSSSGLPWWLRWQRIRLQCRRPWFNSWVGKIPWRRDRLPTSVFLGFPVGSDGKESAMRETWLRSLGRENPLEKGKATHSSIRAWRIPWRERSLADYSPRGCKELDMTE